MERKGSKVVRTLKRHGSRVLLIKTLILIATHLPYRIYIYIYVSKFPITYKSHYPVLPSPYCSSRVMPTTINLAKTLRMNPRTRSSRFNPSCLKQYRMCASSRKPQTSKIVSVYCSFWHLFGREIFDSRTHRSTSISMKTLGRKVFSCLRTDNVTVHLRTEYAERWEEVLFLLIEDRETLFKVENSFSRLALRALWQVVISKQWQHLQLIFHKFNY